MGKNYRKKFLPENLDGIAILFLFIFLHFYLFFYP